MVIKRFLKFSSMHFLFKFSSCLSSTLSFIDMGLPKISKRRDQDFSAIGTNFSIVFIITFAMFNVFSFFLTNFNM